MKYKVNIFRNEQVIYDTTMDVTHPNQVIKQLNIKQSSVVGVMNQNGFRWLFFVNVTPGGINVRTKYLPKVYDKDDIDLIFNSAKTIIKL